MGKNDKKQSNELNQIVPAGLKWLYEMEAVNSPVLLNNLYGNIFSFPNVSDAEILIDKNNRKMLIWIQFNWLSRKIFKSRKKESTIGILDQLQELLPSFEFRIIEDKALFDLAVKRMKQYVLGGENESNQSINNGDAIVPVTGDGNSGNDQAVDGTATTQEDSAKESVEESQSDSQTDTKEQSET